MYECKNCGWKGDDPIDSNTHCPNCGDNVTSDGKPIKEVEKKVDELDLNNDGVVDKKDKSLAGRVLASKKRRK